MLLKSKFLKKLIKLGKKNKLLKYSIVFLTMAIWMICYPISGVKRNWRRYASIMTALAILMLSSSFSFPVNGAFLKPAKVESLHSETGSSVTQNPIEDTWTVDDYLSEDEELVYSSDTIDLRNSSAEGNEQAVIRDGKSITIYNENGEQVEATFEDDWQLILVNKQNPVPDGYIFELGALKGGMKVDTRILSSVAAMMQRAQADGVSLIICSAFRDYNRQEVLFNKKISKYTKQGMSYWDAYGETSMSVTVPGTSEHEIGLALDIITDNYYTLDTGFADTEAGRWLAENSHKFGFILRYGRGKEQITGINFEPWHFRYVGQEAATDITMQNITLEEYVEQIGIK